MSWDLIRLSIMYILAGGMHFVRPKMYVKIIPKFLPKRRTLNLIAGAIEILAGAGLLFSETRSYSAILIIVMLIAFFLVHFNMVYGEINSLGVPKWALILRIPLQFVLIWWAYLYI